MQVTNVIIFLIRLERGLGFVTQNGRSDKEHQVCFDFLSAGRSEQRAEKWNTAEQGNALFFLEQIFTDQSTEHERTAILDDDSGVYIAVIRNQVDSLCAFRNG